MSLNHKVYFEWHKGHVVLSVYSMVLYVMVRLTSTCTVDPEQTILRLHVHAAITYSHA